jgi:hypothetical protein
MVQLLKYSDFAYQLLFFVFVHLLNI